MRKHGKKTKAPRPQHPKALAQPCGDCGAAGGAVCVENGRELPTLHQSRRAAVVGPRLATPRRVRSRSENDRAYRRALGLPDGESLPNKLGTQSSAGAARGGRGASRKGTGKYG